MKVALVNPPIAGHKQRGIGAYTERIYHALKKQRDIAIDLISLPVNPDKYDLIHYPYFDPFFLTLPFIKQKPTVVTVHDLIPLKFPQFFPKGIRGEIKWQIQKLSLANSSAVITDSFASCEDIAKFAQISRDKIKVLYLGVENNFEIISDKNKLRETSQKLQLPEKFILHVGDVNYNKNIAGLIKAYASVSASLSDLELVLMGNGFIKPSGQLIEIQSLIRELKLKDKVHCLGFVGKIDLINVYNLAQVYIQPSFAEGFGLPVLEAMACGCPVVASNTSSLPEITGEAAFLVNPNNIEDIAENIVEIIKNKAKRAELIKRGLQRVNEFTWEKCAKETLAVYKQVTK